MILNDTQAQELVHTLGSKGWTEVMKPVFQLRGRALMDSLLMTEEERASTEFKGHSDDQLKFRLREIQWLLSSVEQAVNSWKQNQKRESEVQPEALGSPYAEGAN